MGIIMMVGIVVSNGVLLIDYTRVLRDSGTALHEAVVKAGRTRLRPILMTTLATVLGLFRCGGSRRRLRGQRAARARGHRRPGGVDRVTLLLIPALYVSIENRLEKHRAPPEEPVPSE